MGGTRLPEAETETRVLDVLRKHFEQPDVRKSPTYAEIGAATGLSFNVVRRTIQRLQEKGKVEFAKNKWRSIRLTASTGPNPLPPEEDI